MTLFKFTESILFIRQRIVVQIIVIVSAEYGTDLKENTLDRKQSAKNDTHWSPCLIRDRFNKSCF
jgi:hypothetical protein